MPDIMQGISLNDEDLECYYEAIDQLQLYVKQYATKELGLASDRITSRVKSKDDIYQKIRRKNYNITTKDDIFQCVEDIAGTRIICDYLSEVELVRKFVHSCDKFKILDEHNYIQSPDCTGYRSCHCTLNLETLNYGEVKCELQIRTTAQHSWAEKSHPLVYKKSKEEIPKVACQMLVGLSNQLHACDEMFETLKNFIKDSAPRPE